MYTYTCSKCGSEIDAAASACPACWSKRDDAWRMNPFARPAPAVCGVNYTVRGTVDDRLDSVRGFDIGECLRALRVVGLQITVRKAVVRRLKALGWMASESELDPSRRWIDPA